MSWLNCGPAAVVVVARRVAGRRRASEGAMQALVLLRVAWVHPDEERGGRCCCGSRTSLPVCVQRIGCGGRRTRARRRPAKLAAAEEAAPPPGCTTKMACSCSAPHARGAPWMFCTARFVVFPGQVVCSAAMAGPPRYTAPAGGLASPENPAEAKADAMTTGWRGQPRKLGGGGQVVLPAVKSAFMSAKAWLMAWVWWGEGDPGASARLLLSRAEEKAARAAAAASSSRVV